MKTKTTLFLIVMLNLFQQPLVNAQPTLTYAGTAPQNAVSITTHSGAYVSPMSGGANQTWNFGTYSGPTTVVINAVAPSSTPHASSYPTATLCHHVPAQSSYQYFESTPTELYMAGFELSPVSMDYSPDMQVVMQYPFTYNDTWTDSYSVDGFTSASFTRDGSVTAIADGYGTLITPSGTFTNCLRISYSSTFTDDFGFATFDGTQQIYEWYREGIHYPLLVISSSVYDGNPASSGAYYTDAVVGIEEHELASLSMFPNPATSQFTIYDLRFTIEGVEIYDMVGQLQTSYFKPQTNSVDVSSLAEGIYFVRVRTEKGSVVKKLIKQ